MGSYNGTDNHSYCRPYPQSKGSFLHILGMYHSYYINVT